MYTYDEYMRYEYTLLYLLLKIVLLVVESKLIICNNNILL